MLQHAVPQAVTLCLEKGPGGVKFPRWVHSVRQKWAIIVIQLLWVHRELLLQQVVVCAVDSVQELAVCIGALVCQLDVVLMVVITGLLQK